MDIVASIMQNRVPFPSASDAAAGDDLFGDEQDRSALIAAVSDGRRRRAHHAVGGAQRLSNGDENSAVRGHRRRRRLDALGEDATDGNAGYTGGADTWGDTRMHDDDDRDADADEGGGDANSVVPNVVSNTKRAPLEGYEWIDALPKPKSSYCYVCCTPASPENHYLREVKAILAQSTEMGDERICRLVYRIYEDHIRRSGARPKPEWSVRAIYEHVTAHCVTPEWLLANAARVTTRLLHRFTKTGRAIGCDGNDLPPCERETRACLNIIGTQMRVASQLQAMRARLGGQ
jgi:hypothetical protein